jgi:hypothetical protein
MPLFVRSPPVPDSHRSRSFSLIELHPPPIGHHRLIVRGSPPPPPPTHAAHALPLLCPCSDSRHREHRAPELDTDRAPEAPEQLPPHPHRPRPTQMPLGCASRGARPTQAELLSGSHISAHQLTGPRTSAICSAQTLDRHKLPRSAVAGERLRTEASSHMVTVTMGDHAVR